MEFTMKKDFILPILAMSLICLFMTGALALVNNVTQPIIEAAAKKLGDDAMYALIPEADQFVPIGQPESDLFPPAITDAYRALNGAGYVFIVKTRGFGGEKSIMVGLCDIGDFHGSTVLSHNETISFANRVFEVRDYLKEQGKSLLYIDSLSGATITLQAYQQGLAYVFEAFEALGGEIL